MIGPRFNGPPWSGNGGYSCGLVGRFIDGPAAVRLRIPPPLDVPMEVRKTGTAVELFHNDQMVASATPATVEIDIPKPPDLVAAEAASRRFRGFDSHFYPGCFVCGPDRDHGDGLRIFAGPVEHGSGPEGMPRRGLRYLV